MTEISGTLGVIIFATECNMVKKVRSPAYISIRKTEVERTEDVGGRGQVLIDFNENNEIVGIELLVDGEMRFNEQGEIVEVTYGS